MSVVEALPILIRATECDALGPGCGKIRFISHNPIMPPSEFTECETVTFQPAPSRPLAHPGHTVALVGAGADVYNVEEVAGLAISSQGDGGANGVGDGGGDQAEPVAGEPLLAAVRERPYTVPSRAPSCAVARSRRRSIFTALPCTPPSASVMSSSTLCQLERASA